MSVQEVEIRGLYCSGTSVVASAIAGATECRVFDKDKHKRIQQVEDRLYIFLYRPYDTWLPSYCTALHGNRWLAARPYQERFRSEVKHDATGEVFSNPMEMRDRIHRNWNYWLPKIKFIMLNCEELHHGSGPLERALRLAKIPYVPSLLYKAFTHYKGNSKAGAITQAWKMSHIRRASLRYYSPGDKEYVDSIRDEFIEERFRRLCL